MRKRATIIRSWSAAKVELKPGGAYKLRARMRTDQESAKAALMVQFYLPAKDGQPGHFWASGPSEVKATKDWQAFEFAFSIPAQGEKGWHEKMKNFRVRIDWPAEQGALLVGDIALEETEALDEWQSWQALGDQHSVIADPKFVAPEKDDYRLAPDSPAWALDFQRIPVEKMGPYASPDRASWPIVEAEGAREHPIAQARRCSPRKIRKRTKGKAPSAREPRTVLASVAVAPPFSCPFVSLFFPTSFAGKIWNRGLRGWRG